MAHRLQYRRDTKANWLKYNPVLMEGEVGYETDTHHQKVGDGVSTYSELEYEVGVGNITQEMGDSETLVMSQKAVTDNLNKLKLVFGEAKFLDGYILTGDAGVIVSDFTPRVPDNWYTLTMLVSEGEKFYIKGVGGNNARLWAFLDSDNFVIGSSPASYKSDGEEIIAPTDAKLLVVNFSKFNLIPELVKLTRYDDNIKNILTETIRIEDKASDASFKADFGCLWAKEIDFTDGYITTGDVGVKVDSFQPITPKYCKSAIIPVQSGVKFYIKGVGGNNARLWAFLDSDNFVIGSSPASYKSDGEEIIAPTNATSLIVNFNVDTPYKLIVKSNISEISELESKQSELERELNKIYIRKLEPTGVGYLLTNVGIGNYVDLIVDNPHVDWRYYITSVTEGQILSLANCKGGINSRLWVFLDAESNLVAISDESVSIGSTPVEVIVPSGATTLIINNNIFADAPSPEFMIYNSNCLELRVESAEKDIELLKKGINTNDINVLVFGNSYSYRSTAQGGGNLLNLFDSIGVNAFLCVIGNGGATFESNYTKHINGEANAYRWEGNSKSGVIDKGIEGLTYTEALRYKPWDYIIFHQASKYSGNLESFSPYLQELIDIAKLNCENENVKFGLMQTWAYANNSSTYPTTSTTDPIYESQEVMYETICNTYRLAFKQFDDISFVIPAGTAIQNARNTELGSNYGDFAASDSDASHINSYGTLITSLVYFNKIYGEKNDVSLSKLSNYSTLFTDEEFLIAIECAKDAIKSPFKQIRY